MFCDYHSDKLINWYPGIEHVDRGRMSHDKAIRICHVRRLGYYYYVRCNDCTLYPVVSSCIQLYPVVRD